MADQVGGTHYQDGNGGIEPFQVIDAWGLDFYRGSALKYIMRAGKKDGSKRSQDLRKAAHYLTEAAERAEKMEARGKPGGISDPANIEFAGKITMPDKITLYRCPETGFQHDAPKNERGRYIAHDLDGQPITSKLSGQTACAWSGEYVGLTADEAARIDAEKPDEATLTNPWPVTTRIVAEGVSFLVEDFRPYDELHGLPAKWLIFRMAAARGSRIWVDRAFMEKAYMVP